MTIPLRGLHPMFKGSIRWFFLFFIILIVLTTIYFVALPNVSDLKRENPSRTAFMKYREEEWKAKKEHHKISQIWVPLSKISPYLIKAVLIAEDDKFWKHEGFDFGGLVAIDGVLLVFDGKGGNLMMVNQSPAAYQELGKFMPLGGQSWTAPIVANGSLTVRNKTDIACFSLK